MRHIENVTIEHTVTIDRNIEGGVTYTGILDLNELKTKLQDNFSIAMASRFPMYIWFPSADAQKAYCYGLYYEPPGDTRTRKAASSHRGIGNLLFNNLPGWAALPERETSATVYSGRNTANDFSKKPGDEGSYTGRMYRAVPALNSKLVIAPATHFYFSFLYALGEFGIADAAYGSLGKLQSCFHWLFRTCGIEDGVFSDWQQFVTALNDVAFEKIRPADKVSGDTELLLQTLVKNKTHVVDFLDQAFSPLHNGFSVIDFNDGLKKEEYPDNLIWMASPCLFIEERLFEEWV